MVSLGPVLRAWLNAWGVLLLLVLVFGLIVPLAMSWRPKGGRALNLTTTSALVLAGGFLLRVVVVLSSEFV
jgi:hypothetical protein